jgi:uncharacterized protein (TIGR03790 family)
MKRFAHIIKVVLLSLFIVAPVLSQAEIYGPESVVVVANSVMEGSLKVARTYMKVRNIPERHLIVLETETREQIPFNVYRDTVRNPILKELISRNLINAIEGETDEFGRETVYLFANKIRYIVLCYGVPTKFGHGGGDDSEMVARFFKGRAGLINTFRNEHLSRQGASIDSALALLLVRNAPFSGIVPNPLFNKEVPPIAEDIFRVTRLDGPSPEAVIRMIKNAIEGEQRGLRGRAYVDEAARKGSYAPGDQWMRKTSQIFKNLGFDLHHDTRNTTIQIGERFDAPVLYAGWYAGKVTGPFNLPGFEFPPGAVAAHLHSYSAGMIRSADRGWVGPFVERGVSATFGNVAEPYLLFTHRFDLFFKALADGWNFGDAAYNALPGLSWQGVAIGDPLFRPFSMDLETQLMTAGDPTRILEDQYVIMRKIHQLESEGKAEVALELANRGMLETPGPALALLKAEILIKNKRKREARRTLEMFSKLEPSNSMEWGLMADIADKLAEIGGAKAGLEIYKALDQQILPKDVKFPILKRGIEVAYKARANKLALEWKAITTPPPAPKPAETPDGQTP